MFVDVHSNIIIISKIFIKGAGNLLTERDFQKGPDTINIHYKN